MGADEEIRAALFLQMSIVNQAVVLFAHSDDCCLIRCPGPFVAVTSIFTQMVSSFPFSDFPNTLQSPHHNLIKHLPSGQHDN
jgi:H+-transporting ATPase